MTVISDYNPMTYIFSCQLLGGKYSKWIVILQEFDLEFTTTKSKESLVFAELLCSLPSVTARSQLEDHIPNETLFLISTLDPWHNCPLLCLLLRMQMSGTPYVGFADSVCHSMHHLSSVAWVIYDPHNELVDLQGVCLGCTTNNVFEYSAAIELLTKVINLDIRALVINQDC
eukprot:PITA_34342